MLLDIDAPLFKYTAIEFNFPVLGDMNLDATRVFAGCHAEKLPFVVWPKVEEATVSEDCAIGVGDGVGDEVVANGVIPEFIVQYIE